MKTLEELAKWHENEAKCYHTRVLIHRHLATASALRELIDKRNKIEAALSSTECDEIRWHDLMKSLDQSLVRTTADGLEACE